MSAWIGIRELRHDLSAVLKRVENGERIVITSRNRPVAELGPVGEPKTTLARLIAEGRATPAKKGPPHDFTPLEIDLGDPNALSKAIIEMRDEERR